MYVEDHNKNGEEIDMVLEEHHRMFSERPREEWTNKLEYLLSLVGYTVGLGSVWRFPYLCIKNGGGAFLIPFIIFTLLCGFPLFYLELALGQFSGKSALTTWSICPLFDGIGYSMIIASGIGAWYYCQVVGWVLLYLGYAFFPTQPWSTCSNDWNTDHCVVLRTGNEQVNYSDVNYSNFTKASTQNDVFSTAATEFWKYKLLNVSSGIDVLGSPQLQLAIALFAAKLAIFLCLVKGVKSVGKVVYVTVIAPFALLLVLLVRSLWLDGSFDGVMLYLTPDFSRLAHYQVWLEAALQVFYSLGPIFGGVITMSSYQKFHGNILRDTAVVVAADLFSNFLCGLVIFSILGFLAHEAGLSVDEVAESGPGLVFIVYPEVLQRLPLPHLWAVIFFFMLFTVGIDTQIAFITAVVRFGGPEYKGYKYPDYTWIIGICLAILPVLPIPLVASKRIYDSHGSLKQRLQKLIIPSPHWGPHGQCVRYEVYNYRGNFWQNVWTNLKGPR
ncbi:sodium-dependent proline transporter-like [Pecten maximus]|uniref:sodium-dependent proline transporter-like n=1 Tax=Pecten maximus TaxID=6579 RepID=UPI001458701F|nr:sodium-dependent proline transporter-like [Pecten maximus]